MCAIISLDILNKRFEMIKMSKLVKLSGLPKSTILYYIKEGLLPEPHKPKPNLHLYDEKCVMYLDFIGYLQKNFNSSIAEIKAIFSHEKFNINSPYKSITALSDILFGANYTQNFSSDEICKEFDIDEKKLHGFISDGFLFCRDGKFSQAEKNILKIILNSNSEELDLIKKYIIHAKELAQIEVAMGLKKQNDLELKHFFDIMLILKPYILNMQTIKTYNEEKKQ